MSLSVAALPIGNALTVAVAPPSSASILWRILRNETGVFTNQNDPSATVLSDSDDTFVVDAAVDLVNGTTYFYTVFYFDGTAWSQDSVVSGIPASTYRDISVDALTLVRDRIAVGLVNEVALGNISNSEGLIKVLLAPPIFEDTKWPVVTVHMQSEKPSERALGEVLQSSRLDESGNYPDNEGWIADTQILIIGWTLNPDERITLRKILRRLVIGNLVVFDRLGLLEIEFSQQDIEDFETYGTPVYQTVGTLSCLAPVAITNEVPTIAGVDVTITEVDPVLTSNL